MTGIFTGHSRGFGFVTVEGIEQDVFIPEDRTGSALMVIKYRSLLRQKDAADAVQKALF